MGLNKSTGNMYPFVTKCIIMLTQWEYFGIIVT